MADAQTFFLLDGHAIAYRAFFGMQGRRFQTRQGLPTGAIYGFTRILVDVIKSYRPTLLAVCFDTKEPTHRHEAFERYKGHRKPPPDDLVLQFPYFQEIVAAFGIPLYFQPGFEADDLIGTLACKAAREDYQVKVITGDRDLFQLIDDKIRILLPSKDSGPFAEFDAEAVQAKYGYTPAQVVDFKALAGDASDNIPGVKGIGEKTAIQLLQEFGSLENIYANLEKVTPKCQKKLAEGREDALLSQQLATIVCDAPVEFNPQSCQLAEPKTEDLLKLFQNLEFNAFQKELPAILAYFKQSESEIEIVSSWSEKRQLRPKVTIISELAQVEALVPILRAGPFAFDTETTGLDCVNTQLVGISLACAGEEASDLPPEETIRNWYLPVGHQLITDSHLTLPRDQALALLKPIFEDPAIPKFGHNAKFDMNVLSLYGIQVAGVCDDTMIMDYLIQPESRHGLKDMAQSYLQLEMQEITALIGTGRKQITMAEVAVEDAAVYAAADAVATWMLRAKMQPDLQAKNLQKLYHEIEIPLLNVLAHMEQIGISLDVPFLATLSQQLDLQLRRLEAELIQAAGENFNQNSPQQLSKILFENLGLPTDGIKRNKTGAYSTDVSTLEKLRPFHPIIDQILEYRQLSKLKSTYVDAMPLLVNPRTGRLHTTFNQTIAATGRLSSTDPNLQNIPIKTELGRQMRKAFVASAPDRRLVSFDYSQIELRLLAHFSQDPRFLQAFAEGGDIHAQTAVEIFNLADLSQVTSEMRRIAKTTNFGIVYGQTTYGLARTLNIPPKEATKIIQRFQERYAGVDAYMQKTLEFARKHGYVETLFQRRRNLEDINHPNRSLREFNERVAINSPLQGTASDLIKLAMIRIHDWIQDSGQPIDLLLQVHDELVFEMPESLLASAIPELRRQMEEVWPLSVP
ncbi:MAG: DNA polymerase I, partial [Candidatus Sericytochromatia bacterium]